jgi:Flp pilus assembly protein TadG
MWARRRARARDDRGVVVVEFALVLPVLMILLLGIFSGAMAWNESQGLGQGSRVAARYASTLPLPVDAGDGTFTSQMHAWLDGIADRAIASSEGAMDLGVAGRAVCVAYVHLPGVTGDETVSRQLVGSSRTSGTSPCFADGQAAQERRVQVMLERESAINTGFYRQTINIRRKVVYRYEAHVGL